MVKPEWELAEEEFNNAFNKGKYSYCHKLPDSKIANKSNWANKGAKFISLPKQPADFIVVCNGVTFFADVKTTANTKGISSSLFKSQAAHKLKILNAGGLYYFFIKSLSNNKWYRLPAGYDNFNAKWEELEKFSFDITK